MLDLGTSFLASVERDPRALAIVDGDVRFTYADWYRCISGVADALDALGLRPGDHLLIVLQNRWQAATVHWACQFAGVILTPVNWRATAAELDYFVENSEAKLVVYDSVAAESVARSARVQSCARIALEVPKSGETAWAALVERNAPDATPQASADAWSIMLYTSGTTAQPKGVPRRHSAERAAAVAHVAQNMYANGERTLGVMPLYHTMGVRSLLAMSLIGGTFVCLPRFDVAKALALIAAEKISNLYLVPTLYHDLIHHERFAASDVRSVRKLSFAGAPMTDGLLKELQAAFKPELFVNHYGSSEIYTFTIDQNAPAKPGSAGRAGINQRVRVAKLGANSSDQVAATGEEGEVIAQLVSDEAFEGYWRQPEADAKAIRDGWYFTGDTGYFDADGDLFVTGRVDDMIITGGENVSPVEIESCLSLHPAVSEVAVVGLPDERWGKVITAFVKRRKAVEEAELDEFCRTSGLAKFKRPRRYLFVRDIPKSPVGKLLRRKLVAGEFEAESTSDRSQDNGTAA
jgi:2-furoate---CoA ligase